MTDAGITLNISTEQVTETLKRIGRLFPEPPRLSTEEIDNALEKLMARVEFRKPTTPYSGVTLVAHLPEDAVEEFLAVINP